MVPLLLRFPSERWAMVRGDLYASLSALRAMSNVDSDTEQRWIDQSAKQVWDVQWMRCP